jgi:3-phenylpropionate/trans-cinnamate dioxygenase ferredoxin component
MPETITVCAVSELPPGERRTVAWEDLEILVVNCDGELLAIEDRCSHDDGDLAEGELHADRCAIECPRHGALFDLRSGKPLTLPAYKAVETFPVSTDGDTITLEVQ